MIYLVLSIFCSAFMILLFKWFPYYKVDNFQAIVVNYHVCILTGMLLTPPPLYQFATITSQTCLPSAIILGALFISCFPLVGRSIQQHGATVTTIAARTSMVMPVMVAVYLYGDSFSLGKFLGIVLALMAIFFTAVHPSFGGKHQFIGDHLNKRFSLPLLPFVVFAINGVIEVIFNYSQRYYIHEGQYEFFTIILFIVAAIIGTLRLLQMLFISGEKKWGIQNLWAGIILGVPNYFSAYFFLLALEKSQLESSSVIPMNNIGIVILTSLSALLLFKEHLSRLNLVGIGLAVIAIGFISGGMGFFS